MGYVPFKLLSAYELVEIHRQIEATCTAWYSDWFPQQGEFLLQCFRAAEFSMNALPNDSVWVSTIPESAEVLALALEPEAVLELSKLLVPCQGLAIKYTEDRSSEMLVELTQRALADLLSKFSHHFKQASSAQLVETTPPSHKFWSVGSGAVIIEIRLGKQRLALAMGNSYLPQLPSSLTQPRPRAANALSKSVDALSQERLKLQVLVGEAQLELGLLQTIAVGDVIKLDAKVSEPLRIVNGERALFCKGYLGSRDGRKSVQLVK